jgi:hypothetical protein
MLIHMLIIQVNLVAVSHTPKSGFGGEFIYVRGYGLWLTDKVFMLVANTGQLLTVADTESISHNRPPNKNNIHIHPYQLKHSSPIWKLTVEHDVQSVPFTFCPNVLASNQSQCYPPIPFSVFNAATFKGISWPKFCRLYVVYFLHTTFQRSSKILNNKKDSSSHIMHCLVP